jgi:hypothetical protein
VVRALAEAPGGDGFERGDPMKRPISRLAWPTALVLAACLAGCASSPEPGGAREVGRGSGGDRRVTQLELQEDLQRFGSHVVASIRPTFAELEESDDPKIRQVALQHFIDLASSTLDIVTGTYADVGLLDMIAFVRLNREVLEAYWVPEVYGPRAEELVTEFRESEELLVPIADKVLTKPQQKELDDLITAWRNDHPRTVHVEWLRLSDFSEKAGHIERERAKKTEGLLSSVHAAVSSADQALSLADRAMFLAPRVPSIIRLQARLGVREVTSDALRRLDEAREPLAESGAIVRDLATITAQSREMVDEAGPLMAEFRRHFPHDPNTSLAEYLRTTKGITGDLAQVVGNLGRTSDEAAKQRIREARGEMDGLIWTVAGALLLVGAGWAVFWWSGYYLAKLLSRTR